MYLPDILGNGASSRFLEILNRELFRRLSLLINGEILRPFDIGVCGGGSGVERSFGI